jgi:phosphoketolase
MELMNQGGLLLDWASDDQAEVILTAVGAYQLEEVLRAARRLGERGIRPAVVYMLEPGRFREPRSEEERLNAVDEGFRQRLYPDSVQDRVFVSHTRPERLFGVLNPLNTGPRTRGLGFINAGGTLSTPGMLFVNRCTWGHIVQAVCELSERDPSQALTAEELDALAGRRSPHGVIIPDPATST